MSATRQIVRAAAMSAAAFAVFAVLPLDGRQGVVLTLLGLVALVVALLPFALRRARRIVDSQTPVLDALETLLHLATLLIVGFAMGYYALATNVPDQLSGVATKVDAIYFSVTILTTVGFGDITATGQLARLVVTVQMLADLVLIAVGVKVVTWAVQRSGSVGPGRRDGRRDGVHPAD